MNGEEECSTPVVCETYPDQSAVPRTTQWAIPMGAAHCPWLEILEIDLKKERYSWLEYDVEWSRSERERARNVF